MFYKGSTVIGIAVASPRPVFLYLFILCPFLALCNMFLAEDEYNIIVQIKPITLRTRPMKKIKLAVKSCALRNFNR